MQDKPYHVYVLWSDAGHRFYIGLTEDLGVRVVQHNAGDSKWTKRYAGSWRLVWSEVSRDLSSARRLETFLKHQRGGNGFYEYTGLVRPEGSGS